MHHIKPFLFYIKFFQILPSTLVYIYITLLLIISPCRPRRYQNLFVPDSSACSFQEIKTFRFHIGVRWCSVCLSVPALWNVKLSAKRLQRATADQRGGWGPESSQQMPWSFLKTHAALSQHASITKIFRWNHWWLRSLQTGMSGLINLL